MPTLTFKSREGKTVRVETRPGEVASRYGSFSGSSKDVQEQLRKRSLRERYEKAGLSAKEAGELAYLSVESPEAAEAKIRGYEKKAAMQEEARQATATYNAVVKQKAQSMPDLATRELAAYTVNRPRLLAEAEAARAGEESKPVTALRRTVSTIELRLQKRFEDKTRRSTSLTQAITGIKEDGAVTARAGKEAVNRLTAFGAGAAVGSLQGAELIGRAVTMPKKTGQAIVAFGSKPASQRRAAVTKASYEFAREFSPVEGKPAFALGKFAGSAGTFNIAGFLGKTAYQETRLIGRTSVPVSDIAEAEVLAGAQQFPSTKASPNVLVREFYTGKPAQTLIGLRKPAAGSTYGLHATEFTFKEGAVQAGSSETAGLYVAPSASIHFLRLGGRGASTSSPAEMTFFPKLEPPSIVAVETRVSRIPAGSRTTFTSMQEFVQVKARGKGEAFVSPAFEAARKTEKEAILPQESLLVKLPESFKTRIEGKPVKLEFFKAVDAAELSPEGVKSAIRSTSKASSSARPTPRSLTGELSKITGVVRSSPRAKPTNYTITSYTPKSIVPRYVIMPKSSSQPPITESPTPPIKSTVLPSVTRSRTTSKVSMPSVAAPSTSPPMPSTATPPPVVPSLVSPPRPPMIRTPVSSRRRAFEEDTPRRFFKKTVKTSRSKPVRYIPTAFSIVAGVKAKKPTRFLTGLELRPVVIGSGRGGAGEFGLHLKRLGL